MGGHCNCHAVAWTKNGFKGSGTRDTLFRFDVNACHVLSMNKMRDINCKVCECHYILRRLTAESEDVLSGKMKHLVARL